MRAPIWLAALLLSACASVGSFSDALGAAYLTADTLAVTVAELCASTEPRGPCAEDAPLSTAQKELARARLLEAVDALDLARLLYAQGDTEAAGNRLQEARRLLAIADGLVRRYQ